MIRPRSAPKRRPRPTARRTPSSASFRFHCRLLSCPEDAREACQDAFVRAHESLRRFVPQARFSTWLYRIALNLCRDRLRARRAGKRRPSESAGAAADPGTDWTCPRPPPDESVALSEDLARLGEGIDQLPRRLREPLILTALEGMSHQECAAILRSSTRAVEGRPYRARRSLFDRSF